MGGHDVPEEKIKSRYKKALNLIPELLEVCDIMHIYDNSDTPFRIFKKRKTKYYHWQNEFWTIQILKDLQELQSMTIKSIIH